MSNPLRAIGKVFKKTLHIVKKFALPALAIGAAVLTGGAALGIMPAIGGIGGLGAQLGLTSGLSSILATAGQGALGGIVTSAVTGGSIKKGASLGFVAGGVAGGLKQLVNPSTPFTAADRLAKGSAGTITQATSPSGANSLGMDTLASRPAITGSLTPSTAFMTQTASPSSGGIGSMIKLGAPTTLSASTTTPVAMAASPSASIPASINAPVDAVKTSVGTTSQAGTGGGIGKFVTDNQFLASGLVQGLGSGISAKAEAESAERQAEARRQQIAENYGSGTGFYSSPTTQAPQAVPDAAPTYSWRVDPRTGNVYKDYS